VANKIWWIENGELKEYLGTFDEFNEWNSNRVIEEKPTLKTVHSPVSEEPKKVEIVETSSKKTLSKNQVQKLEQEMQQIENEMKAIEKSNALLTEMMHSEDMASNADKLVEITIEHKDNTDKLTHLQRKYDEVMEIWLSAQD
jgi:ATP-binding cassette subfamily F protein 3